MKAVIFRLKFQSYTNEENEMSGIIKDLDQDLKDARFPERPLLHSMKAEIYWQYYQRNRYRILHRTETRNFTNEDIETWTASQFVDAAVNEYTASLKDAEESKHTQINIFDNVLEKGNTDGRKFRPSLYDFLAHRAIDFYSNEESGLTRPADHFELNSAFYLNAADMFLNFILTTKDTADFKFKAISLYQELIDFHHDDQHPGALLDVDLERLKFVHNQLTIPTKDSLYFITLKQIADQYKEYPGCTQALYEQAMLLKIEGEKYSDKQELKYKWKMVQAEALCTEAISRFPYSDGGMLCKELKKELNETSLSFITENVNVPGYAFRARVAYKNIQHLFLKIVKAETMFDDEEEPEMDKRIDGYLKMEAVKAWDIALPPDSDKQNHSVEISIPALDPGKYRILVSAFEDFTSGKKSVAYAQCRISNIGLVQRRLENGTIEIYLFNRENGKPMKDVQATAFAREYNYTARKYITRQAATFTSDENGRIGIPVQGDNYRNFNLEFVSGNDKLYLNEGFYQYPSPRISQVKPEQTFFFTDRSIYRPGQTIYFKGIMVQGVNEEAQLITKQNTTVTFYDVNGQKITEQDFVTSENGTFHGEFIAPQGSMNGQMRIQNKSGSCYFRVEEYKRPKFEVEFEAIKNSYRLGEQVKVTGKATAYSGQAIDGATVQFHVVRSARYPIWCYWKPFFYPSLPEVQLLDGTTQTDSSGKFSVTFQLQPDESLPLEDEPIFSYAINADVTDLNGETRSADATVSAAYKAMELSTNVSTTYNNELRDSIVIFSRNLNGEHIPATVQLEISELKAPQRILRERLWEKCDKNLYTQKEYVSLFPYDVYANENDASTWEQKQVVWKGTVNTATDSVIFLRNKNLSAGKYLLHGTAKDIYGQEVKLEQLFTVIDPGAESLPVTSLDWFYVLKDDAVPGQNDQVLIECSEKNVSVLYETELNGSIISKEWIELNGNQQRISIPVKEQYRGNFTVHFTFMKHGRAFTHSHTMKVPWDNKTLQFSYETFRSKLTPGQKEEWRIRISGIHGDKVSAELLASMYDASLDYFTPHDWNFSVYSTRYSSQQFRPMTFGLQNSMWYEKGEPEKNTPHEFIRYDQLNWFGYQNSPYERMYKGVAMGAGAGYSFSIADQSGKSGPAAPMESKAEIAANAEMIVQDSVAQSKTPAPVVSTMVRKNLSETAFFYPTLMTNDSGDVLISFTSPEALTKWKFMAFAHTHDLKYGISEKEIVTQKQLMVTPNAPRFFREGDKIIFPAKVTSLSDSDLHGTARLEMLDAITMKSLDAEFSNNSPVKNFTLRKGESAALSWSLDVPEGKNAVTYRIIATAGNFSDGEEQAVPVLSNKQLVTESLPLWQRGNSPATFDFTKLENSASPSLRNIRLTLEYTSNPAWTALQALPYMMEYPYQCSEQIFSRYYANAIATHVANSSPRIKAVFDSWKSTSPGAFLSNLEKNQELKSIVLEETPWVMEAQDESERKKRIGLLFDLNKMSHELSTALHQLQHAQTPNGAWAWFEGMPEDRYITQHILSGLGHLDHLRIQSLKNDQELDKMISRAILYLDQRIVEDYEELKKSKTDLDKVHIGNEQLHYLYARSYFPEIPKRNTVQNAYDYYLKQAKKFRVGSGEYFEGMIALTLERTKDHEGAMEIIRSLKENAQNKEELGMYWVNNTNGYGWSRASIETQALLIEAFNEIAKDTQSVDAMKVWLLRQKQTQDWKTTKATAEACYALLLSGNNWLAETAKPKIYVGSQEVDIPENAEAGTGYFKTSWNGNDIKNEMGKVRIVPDNRSASSTGISWGAMYWQYMESLDKITGHETPMSLKKELFVERTSPRGPVMELVTDTTSVKIGDRIKVRIELRSDRDMEYVHMKDMRASGLEPENVLSQYKWQDGLGYYESTRDAATNFFFSYFRKGVYVFEYSLRATQEGDFSNGITNIECMYAPEFSSHSFGKRLVIRGK
ncbi:MAG TPA: alpha-2-macroglobulin family protein [Bacteroidia bacterium]|nr:alpha-2-macroglobulin family protein [Bacteroidia bacterium]